MLGFATLIESGVYSLLKRFDICWYIYIYSIHLQEIVAIVA